MGARFVASPSFLTLARSLVQMSSNVSGTTEITIINVLDMLEKLTIKNALQYKISRIVFVPCRIANSFLWFSAVACVSLYQHTAKLLINLVLINLIIPYLRQTFVF